MASTQPTSVPRPIVQNVPGKPASGAPSSSSGSSQPALLSIAEKMLVVAPFMPCCQKYQIDGKTQRCSCTGWKRPQHNVQALQPGARTAPASAQQAPAPVATAPPPPLPVAAPPPPPTANGPTTAPAATTPTTGSTGHPTAPAPVAAVPGAPPTAGVPAPTAPQQAPAGQAPGAPPAPQQQQQHQLQQQQQQPGAPTVVAGAAPVPVPSMPSAPPDDDLCVTCHHRMTAHGDLGSIQSQELDRRVGVIKEILQLTRSVREALANNPNSQLQQAYYQQMLHLKEKLFRPNAAQAKQAAPAAHPAASAQPTASQSATVQHPHPPQQASHHPQHPPQQQQPQQQQQQPQARDQEAIRKAQEARRREELIIQWLGQPPFEEPTIVQSLKNFIMSRFASGQDAAQRSMYEKICLLLIGVLNRFDLVSVEEHMKQYPGDRMYQMNFQRWLRYCRERGQYFKAYKLNFAEIFGRTMLTSVFQHLRKLLETQFLPTADLRPSLPIVLNELAKELMDPESPIFKKDFLDKLQAKRRAEAQGAQIEGDRKRKREDDDTSGEAPPEKVIVVVPVSAAPPQIQIPQGIRSQFPQSVPQAPQPCTDTHVPSGNLVTGDGIILSTMPADSLPGTKPKPVPPGARRDAVIEFRVVSNNAPTEQVLIWMVELKNVFSKQLPKMPREYIARMVFDRNHRNLMLLRGGTLIGGICFRPFPTQNFAEIVFLAVVNTWQIKGYGTHLMNHLKEYVKRERIGHFLTYGDNSALPYFKKQGFTTNLTQPRDKWFGVIKDYDGGTLMECVINQKIDYLAVRDITRQQREAILEKIKGMTNSHVVHPGLPQLKYGPVDVASIPGMEKVKHVPTPPPPEEMAKLQDIMQRIFAMVKAHRDSWPFHEPVDGSQVRDYYEIIKDPIDLTVIGKRLASGSYYKTMEIFLADLKLMLTNCKTYNAETTIYYKAAETLQSAIARSLKQHLSALG